MPAESQETNKTYLQINPIEELLKAVGIVHGREAEDRMRFVVSTILIDVERRENTPPWTMNRIQHMLNTEVKYKDWSFCVQGRGLAEDDEIDLRLRAEWEAPDAVTGKMEIQKSRWWPLSKHMVKTEIIQTAFLCVMKAEEHELRETFLYRGKAVFNTHININTLHAMSDSIDVRTDPRPEAPANQRRE